MKKCIIFLFLILLIPVSGCSIDYTSYYEKYGDVVNREDPTKGLVSSKIEEGVLEYPLSNGEYIDKYSKIYPGVSDLYEVYSSYYSSEYDVLYIAYDKIGENKQTLDSKSLALIEEHLLNYFKSDRNKSEYREYIKAIRIYPDYESSACRTSGDESYNQIEGCANYDQKEAFINLNDLYNLERFFNPLEENDGHYITYTEPKRDTFAHEYGHVSTYYHMILKGDGSYEGYLKLRLKEKYDDIYPGGIITSYDSSITYAIQPTEILADDYVDLYYNVSDKVESDIYNYELDYRNLRNSLSSMDGVISKLKDDNALYGQMKEYYNIFIDKNITVLQTPIVVKINGSIYNSLHDIKNGTVGFIKNDKEVIALSEIVINGKVYYRVVLSNVVMGDQEKIMKDDLRDYSSNIGYILKDECELTLKTVIKFERYEGDEFPTNSFFSLVGGTAHLFSYYDFSYFIVEGMNAVIYNVMDNNFGYKNMPVNKFE